MEIMNQEIEEKIKTMNQLQEKADCAYEDLSDMFNKWITAIEEISKHSQYSKGRKIGILETGLERLGETLKIYLGE